MSRAPTLTPWAFCVAVLLAPGILVWTVRLGALVAGCAPGAGLCHGMPIGAGLRDTLTLAWVVPTSPILLVGLSLIALLLAFRAFRPLTGTLSLLVLPILTTLIPILAVLSARYEGCAVSADALGNCQLWGAAMGMSFHNAEIARDVIFAIFPYTFALTMMLGVLGFFFARPKPPVETSAMAKLRHSLGDDDRAD